MREIITKLQAAMKRPPKIVSAYLDASQVACVHGGGGTVAFPSFSPAGGTDRGWWSNGTYLIFKQETVAVRNNESRTLQTLPEYAGLLEGSGLVKGLKIVPVATLA